MTIAWKTMPQPVALPCLGQPAAPRQRESWGWLPMLSVTCALGLLVMALADNAARAGQRVADLLFWAALLLIVGPVAVRLACPSASRGERVGLLALLSVALYLVKALAYPTAFAMVDEFQHWRTEQDIFASHHLFTANSILPISPRFPGLEIVTNAVANLSGLSIFAAGVIVIGVARVLLALALYLCYELVSGSRRTASIATLLYMANPLYLFFDAQFAYESLAIPLAALALYCLLRREQASGAQQWWWTTALLTVIGSCFITHHLTTLALLAFLLTLVLVNVAGRRWARRRLGQRVSNRWLWIAAALAVPIVIVGWTANVGKLMIGYLGPSVSSGVTGLLAILSGHAASRKLFQDGSGVTAPIWERLVSIGSLGLLVLGVGAGCLYVARSRRTNMQLVGFALASLALPFSQIFRLTPNGSQAASRPMGVLFIAVALVVAIGAQPLWRSLSSASLRSILVAGAFCFIFVGSVITGSGPIWARMPGPYRVISDQRSVSPDGIAAAAWTRQYLGAGHWFATDHVDQLLLGSYGDQNIVSVMSTRVDLSPILLSTMYGPFERSVMQRGHVEFILCDLRLSASTPGTGYYFESMEPGAFQHTAPISIQALTKYDGASDVDRLFDNGNIVIYSSGVNP